MTISYKVVSKRPAGMAGDREVRYYPALTGRSVADLGRVCKIISDRSTFSNADVVRGGYGID